MKRQAIDWEKIFANHITDKVLIFRNTHNPIITIRDLTDTLPMVYGCK